MSWKDTTIEVLAKRLDYVEECFADERGYLEDTIANLRSEIKWHTDAADLVGRLYLLLDTLKDEIPELASAWETGSTKETLLEAYNFIINEHRRRTT